MSWRCLLTQGFVCRAAVFILTGIILIFAAPGFGSSAAHKEILKSGMTVIFEHNDSSATTFMQFLIRGGRRAEPEGKQGLSFLTTRLAVEIPDSSKIQELMVLSSRFSVTSRGDYSLINIECLTSNFEPTLKILSKIIADPIISGLRADAIKKYMSHQSEVEKDDSLIIGHHASLAAFFGRPGYEGSIYGHGETLRAIKAKDASDFYKRWFTAPNIVLSVASDLEEEQILSLLDKYLAQFPSAESSTPLPEVVRRVPQERKIFIERETKQTLVSLAFPLSEISPRSFLLNEFLQNFLGEGAGSKLWPLRTEEKLAYSMGCRVTQMLEGGLLEAYLETDKEKIEEALKALTDALTSVWEKGLTQEEFEAARAMTRANFLRDNELKMIKAATLASFEALGLGFDYFDKFLAGLEDLTLDETAAYIKSLLNPEKAVVVVAGPGVQAQKPAP
ncbi:MAG: pitrilysin family protein [Clostridiales bacterium]|nr:pitrilysin family protein [Clostridiales bacterium]